MNENKFKGIVLKLTDYKDADKLASIFSLEHGVISAKFTGVKRENAKLKGIAQPFVLADFSIIERNNLRKITTADLIDNFYTILTNYNKTICGYIVLDIIKTILPAEKSEPDLFLLTINTLNSIENNNEYVATIDYVLKFLTFTGLGQEFYNADYVYLDTLNGNFCLNRTNDCLTIDKKVYNVLKQINNFGAECKAENFNESTLKQALRLLNKIIYLKYGEEIKTFAFI